MEEGNRRTSWQRKRGSIRGSRGVRTSRKVQSAFFLLLTKQIYITYVYKHHLKLNLILKCSSCNLHFHSFDFVCLWKTIAVDFVLSTTLHNLCVGSTETSFVGRFHLKSLNQIAQPEIIHITCYQCIAFFRRETAVWVYVFQIFCQQFELVPKE